MSELLWIRDAELTTPAPAGRGDVLVANGRVLAMGTGLDPRGCGVPVRIIDAAGHWLCPGLVDGLVHFGGGDSWPVTESPSAKMISPAMPSASRQRSRTTGS